MRKIIIISIFFVITILFHAAHAAAADRYVRAGATGTGSGLDWTNAYTSLPAALVRGDTYYIADGTYPSYTVDDAVSGSLYITIKKATISNHGTNTGWNDSYGDGQAVFTEDVNEINGSIISIITSYVIFDGVVGGGSTTGVNGSGSDPTTYGFKIIPPNCNRHNRLLGIPPVGYSSLNISNITISNVATINCGNSYNYVQAGIYSNPLSASNMTISNNYFLDNSSHILIRYWKDSTIENNFFDANWSSYNNVGVAISSGEDQDIILRNNIFRKINLVGVNGTGLLSVHKYVNYRWQIYNNIAYNSLLSIGFGNGDSGTEDVVRNFNVHHNIFINCEFYLGAFFVGNLTTLNYKSYAYNNLFYNSNNPILNNSNYTSGAIVYGYSAHFNSSGTYDSSEGGTAQVGTGDPFVDSANDDFHLNAPTDAGRALSSPYDIDADGNSRGGTDGFWDRGVYEYDGIPMLKLSPGTYSVYEGTATATISVTRIGSSSGAVSVDYATSNGSATAGSDYTAVNGILNWGDGDTAAKLFYVSITNDTAVEGDETVNLTLSNPNGAKLASPSTATLTIFDNDGPPILRFENSSYSISEGVGTATIRVRRTGSSVGAVSVNYATSNGTATAGSDYTAKSGTLNWAAGDTAAKQFTVSITNDTAVESSETVNITLSNPTNGAALSGTNPVVLTITNDDSNPNPNPNPNPDPDPDITTNSSAVDAEVSGGGCGFVKGDDNGKGPRAKGEGMSLMIMLILTLAGIAIARRFSLLKNSSSSRNAI